jgi:hypothetical protein
MPFTGGRECEDILVEPLGSAFGSRDLRKIRAIGKDHLSGK